jgi:hypothetical protein
LDCVRDIAISARLAQAIRDGRTQEYCRAGSDRLDRRGDLQPQMRIAGLAVLTVDRHNDIRHRHDLNCRPAAEQVRKYANILQVIYMTYMKRFGSKSSA